MFVESCVRETSLKKYDKGTLPEVLDKEKPKPQSAGSWGSFLDSKADSHREDFKETSPMLVTIKVPPEVGSRDTTQFLALISPSF